MKLTLPAWLQRWYYQSVFYRRHQSRHHNIYHCTVQKSASQWVRALLSDPRTHRYCGLRSCQYQDDLPGGYDPRKLTQRRFDQAFSAFTVITPLYVEYEGFASIPKPAEYAAFFVMRDPRDVLISWYFSSKHSHPLIGAMDRVRQDLTHLSEADGLLYSLDYLNEFGLFAAQRSWVDASAKDPHVLLVRYEDLVGVEQAPTVARLFAHCDIRMPARELIELLASHSFERHSGRQRGTEDRTSHFRKGVQGDWRNHWDAEVDVRFNAVAGDLLERWGYAE